MGSSQSSQSVEDAARGLECPVCQEHFRDPRVLPCGHSLCLRPCLEQVAGRSVVSGGGKLSCPECRQEHEVPAGGVEEFVKNFAVIRNLEPQATGSSRITGPSLCPLCTVEDELLRCIHCEGIICYRCLVKHIPEFEADIRKLAMDTQREARDALRGCVGQHSDGERRVEEQKQALISEIEDAAQNMTRLIKEKMEAIKSEARQSKERDLGEVRQLSHEVTNGWSKVEDICGVALKTLEDQQSSISPAQLAQVSAEIKAERQQTQLAELRLASAYKRQPLALKVNRQTLEKALQKAIALAK